MNVKDIYSDETRYYVYVYRKLDGTPIYVGKGKLTRFLRHYRDYQGSNKRLHNLLSSKLRGEDEFKTGAYSLFPDIIPADSEADALEIEELLVEMIGRENMSKGPLFNVVPGGMYSPEETRRGGGWDGKKHTEATKVKMSESMTGLKRSTKACENIGRSKAGKAQNTLPCQFCKCEVSKSNLQRHELKCEKNPNALPRSRANSQAYSMGRSNLRSKSVCSPESDQTSGPEELLPQS